MAHIRPWVKLKEFDKCLFFDSYYLTFQDINVCMVPCFSFFFPAKEWYLFYEHYRKKEKKNASVEEKNVHW